jgi:hypothetical protein
LEEVWLLLDFRTRGLLIPVLASNVRLLAFTGPCGFARTAITGLKEKSFIREILLRLRLNRLLTTSRALRLYRGFVMWRGSILHPTWLTGVLLSIELIHGLLEFLASSLPKGTSLFKEIIAKLRRHLGRVVFR